HVIYLIAYFLSFLYYTLPTDIYTLSLHDALPILHSLLNGLAQTSQPEQTAYELARQRMSGRSDALSQLRTSAARLPKPIRGWLEVIADDSWMLGHAYARQLPSHPHMS